MKELLAPGEVHIWYAKAELETPTDVLSAKEVELANACVAIRRAEYVTARRALRLLLSHYNPQIAPRDWSFRENEFGKPEIANPDADPEFRFNVTHSGGRIAIAFGRGGELGVDIEYGLRSADLLMIAESHFAPAERAELQRWSGARMQERFFHYWTLKEAFIKAVGSGLSIPLEQFTMQIEEAPGVSRTSNVRVAIAPELAATLGQPRWQFRLMNLGESFYLSVARNGEGELKVIECGMIEQLPKAA